MKIHHIIPFISILFCCIGCSKEEEPKGAAEYYHDPSVRCYHCIDDVDKGSTGSLGSGANKWHRGKKCSELGYPVICGNTPTSEQSVFYDPNSNSGSPGGGNGGNGGSGNESLQDKVDAGESIRSLLAGPYSASDFCGIKYGGGIILAIHNSQTIMIVSENNISQGAPWGCTGTLIPGTQGTNCNSGPDNTKEILSGCSQSGIAARLCDELVLNGYTDWHLPSECVCGYFFDLYQKDIGNFRSGDVFWTSGERKADQAHAYKIGSQATLTSTDLHKSTSNKVRAVRNERL